MQIITHNPIVYGRNLLEERTNAYGDLRAYLDQHIFGSNKASREWSWITTNDRPSESLRWLGHHRPLRLKISFDYLQETEHRNGLTEIVSEMEINDYTQVDKQVFPVALTKAVSIIRIISEYKPII